jgi:rare lipoprotein A
MRVAARPALLAAAGWRLALLATLLGGCATRTPAPDADGPPAQVPPGLMRVPDAVPRPEPVRAGGPNKPYALAGRVYTPFTDDRAWRETGGASWYGRKFHGRPTASGEPYDMFAMTAAHRTLPIPSYVRVRNPANGREVVVRVNDRGPFAAGRVIDLSYTAALKLGLLGGVAPVELVRITPAEIAAGWRAPAPADDPAPGEPPPASAAAGHWLQLGAFRQREGAEALRERVQRELAALATDAGTRLLDDDGLLRVLAGPLPTREAAQRLAAQLQPRLGVAGVPVWRAP